MFHRMGIDEIRLDYGFGAKAIAVLSNNNMGIDIAINASTVDNSHIEEIFRKWRE